MKIRPNRVERIIQEDTSPVRSREEVLKNLDLMVSKVLEDLGVGLQQHVVYVIEEEP